MRLIIGRAGTGKSRLCLEEIREEIQNDPWGLPLILLVPEQATHQMEMSLTHDPAFGGILRAQVLSFRRLGWRVFSEAGGGGKAVISEVGKRMLLRRLLLKHRPQLRIFARSATRPGMADLLAQAIAEFKIYRIVPNDLKVVQDADELLIQKTTELAFLYEEFNQSLCPNLRDGDDELNLVADRISAAPFLKGAKIWIDGFKGFTPQELYIIQALAGVAAEITISLPLDPRLVIEKSSEFKPGEEVFWGPLQTYQSLVSLARDSKIPVSHIHLNQVYRFHNPELQHLEKYYNAYPTKSYKQEESMGGKNSTGIILFAAANKRAELEGVARELRRLTREEGKLWRDCLVVTRDLAGYQGLIEQVFHAYEIPFFLDHKRPVIHHPLLELLAAALEAAHTDWAYEPLFRCLKTDFFPLSRDTIDRLENYCLAFGLQGKAWRSNRPWEYTRGLESVEELKHINEARQTIFALFNPVVQALRPNPESREKPPVTQITKGLYDLLVRLQVPEQLQSWADEAHRQGNLAEAQLQSQIWEAVIEVLDELVAGLGDEILDLPEFAMILTSGFENLKLGLIPPGLDQVLVGSLDRSRNPETDLLFLIGANDGILPGKPSSDGVFNELEREYLEQLGIALAPKGKAQLYEEQYYIYIALTRAQERLYITYPLTDEEGKGLTVSPVINRIKTIFPALRENYLGQDPNCINIVDHPYALLPAYALQLQNLRQGRDLTPLWESVRCWFQERKADFPQFVLLEGGVNYKNLEEKLPQPLARRLYGKRLVTSVSRLEQFARCPFAHYAQYGLKLKERANYRLSPPDMGQFFHAVLHDFAVTLREKELNWGELSKVDSWQLVNEVADKVALDLQNMILYSNARYRYLTHKLKRTVHHAVRVLGEHARQGTFVPIELEVKFGPEGTLPALEIPLQDGNHLILRGQIDRVDCAMIDNQIYLRIFDYKSREAQVNLNQIFYGLDLQLLAYLDAALQGAQILLTSLQQDQSHEQIHPAGFLYFPVIDPQLKGKTLLDPQQVEKDRIKAVKVKGYLLADQQVLRAMDRNLDSSDLLGIKLTKEGEFRKGSPILTEEQFTLLRKHLHHFLRQSGEALLDGTIAIAPYRQGKNHACQYCTYKPICHFDPYLPENHYRNLPVIADQDFWHLLNIGDAEEASTESMNLAISPQRPESLPVKNIDSKSQLMNTRNKQKVNWLGEEEFGTGKEGNTDEQS